MAFFSKKNTATATQKNTQNAIIIGLSAPSNEVEYFYTASLDLSVTKTIYKLSLVPPNGSTYVEVPYDKNTESFYQGDIIIFKIDLIHTITDSNQRKTINQIILTDTLLAPFQYDHVDLQGNSGNVTFSSGTLTIENLSLPKEKDSISIKIYGKINIPTPPQ